MTEKTLVILGAGGYGQTVADVAEQLGYRVLFLDDAAEQAVGKCEEFSTFIGENTEFYPAFGNNALRLSWLNRLEAAGCALPVLVHPRAYVSPKATLTPGTVVLPGAIVNTLCVVKKGCIVNCGAIVDHGCTLEEGVHVCPGAVVKAENHLPAGRKVESGEVIPNRTYQ